MDLQSWLSTNWQPLLFGGVLGLILGWLLTWMPMSGAVKRYQTRAEQLESKLAESEKALADARQQAQMLEAGLSTSEASLDETRGQVLSLQTSMERLVGGKAAEDVRLEALGFELEDLRATNARLLQENEALKENLEGFSADIAKTRDEMDSTAQALANKDTALNEAYLRAVRLQRELSDHRSTVASSQIELENLRREVVALTAANQALEKKLHDARGDVANELAVLTSSMLRVKDDALTQANATIAALTSQLNEMKSGESASS